MSCELYLRKDTYEYCLVLMKHDAFCLYFDDNIIFSTIIFKNQIKNKEIILEVYICICFGPRNLHSEFRKSNFYRQFKIQVTGTQTHFLIYAKLNAYLCIIFFNHWEKMSTKYFWIKNIIMSKANILFYKNWNQAWKYNILLYSLYVFKSIFLCFLKKCLFKDI